MRAPASERTPQPEPEGQTRLPGRLGVTDVSVGEPHGLRIVVDAVPESTTGCDLVLPLLHFDTVDAAPTE